MNACDDQGKYDISYRTQGHELPQAGGSAANEVAVVARNEMVSVRRIMSLRMV